VQRAFMQKSILPLIIFLFLFKTHLIHAVNPDTGPVTQEIDIFFKQLQYGNLEEAAKKLFKESPIGEKNLALENFTHRLSVFKNAYGKLNQIEFIDLKITGENLIQLRYLGHHEEFPIRFVFTYFRYPSQENRWRLGHFLIDDQVHRFFD